MLQKGQINMWQIKYKPDIITEHMFIMWDLKMVQYKNETWYAFAIIASYLLLLILY